MRRFVLLILLAWIAAGAVQGDLIPFSDPLTGALLEIGLLNSGPTPPPEYAALLGPATVASGARTLSNVPTSSWTYGCSATAAGMIFGYYDLKGYAYMYQGPGAYIPLSDLGNQISLIATQQGFDGRTTPGHVDNYWISYNSAGPDPWVGVREEHAWADCTADFMGTNQWKWDWNLDGSIDANRDGGTTYFSYASAEKLYDYIPPAAAGLPQTELCHGLRLFAESRGYIVLQNYTQKIDTLYAGAFSFDDYCWEIDQGFPVMVHLVGHSVVGVGYDRADETIYLHDTWGDYVASMIWGGEYAGMSMQAVTVIHLDPAGIIPEPGTVALLGLGLPLLAWWRRRAA